MDERYQRGKIYKLTCDDPTMVYYGSTIRTLTRRLTNHNAPSNNTVSKNMRDAGGLKIELVEDYPCNSKRELEQREQYYIANNECINYKCAFHTEEERLEKKRQLHIINRDKELEQKRKYHEANKEKEKAYREANKEKLAEKYLENRNIIREQQRIYRECNRDKINQQKRERYHATKTIN
jgi:hypothetical protein